MIAHSNQCFWITLYHFKYFSHALQFLRDSFEGRSFELCPISHQEGLLQGEITALRQSKRICLYVFKHISI